MTRSAVVAAASALCLGAAVIMLRAFTGGVTRVERARRIIVTIPAGTADDLARGRPTRSVPTYISAHTGDTLLLVNDDKADHMLGPFYVGGRQSLTVPLWSPGTYRGTCVLQPNHRFTLVVR
ncbi:MAG TPA: hypothetical protein VMI13_10845 [Solirubrobacteraceae bacterium]|nr:hypothetical protein [Solirubrobacteraceae bacterium]